MSAKKVAGLLLRRDPAQLAAMVAMSPQLAQKWLSELTAAQRHHRVELSILSAVVKDLKAALQGMPGCSPAANVVSFARVRPAPAKRRRG